MTQQEDKRNFFPLENTGLYLAKKGRIDNRTP